MPKLNLQPYSFFNLGAIKRWVVNDMHRKLHPREISGIHCTGGSVAFRDALIPTGVQTPNRPARNESSYTDYAIPRGQMGEMNIIILKTH
jgi:hypothetical protein